MKIRKGFVTNSSSSSFIIGYNNLEEITNKIVDKCVESLMKTGMTKESEDNFRQSVKRVVEAYINKGKITKAELRKGRDKRIWEELVSQAIWDIRYNGRSLIEYDWDDIISEKTKVGKFMRSRLKDKKEIIEEGIGRYKHILYVSVGDHTDIGAELEHCILPQLEETIAKFNHH